MTELEGAVCVFAKVFSYLSASLHPVAYLDGGTGSMLLQAALAGALSAAFVVKTRWAQLKSFIAVRARRSRG